MFAALIARLRAPKPAHRLYFAIVGAAREPALFRDGRVPDTFDGRFDLVLLHAAMVFRRLRAEGAAATELADGVFEVMCGDFDRSLREVGIGDTGIGRRVKAMARAFYGRAHAYDRALAGEEPLEAALRRNLYADQDVPPEAMAGLVTRVRAFEAGLRGLSVDDLRAGRLAPAATAALTPSGRRPN